MPGFNGLGPNGQGSMTGRGLGPCNKDNTVENKETENNATTTVPRFFNGPRGMGRRSFARGRGRGRGFGARGMGFRDNF